MELIGAFLLPRMACGWSTAFAPGCLAFRRVQKEGGRRLFTDTHISSGGLIYQVAVPSLFPSPPYAVAPIIKEYGNIYHGKKGRQINGEVVTTCLRWDPTMNCLWWSASRKYDINGGSPVHVMYWPGTPVSTVAPKLTIPNLWQRGGTLEVPAIYRPKLGWKFGVGFGGYYSIFSGGSWGPSLTVGNKVLLAYPEPHRCPRPGNYFIDNSSSKSENNWLGRMENCWTAADEIGGENYGAGAVWIEDKLMFFCSLGVGAISYENGGVQCTERQNYIYTYSSAEVLDVADRKLNFWEPVPKIQQIPNLPGLKGRVAGVAYDQVEHQLYVYFAHATHDEPESYPAVGVYQM